MRGPRIKHVCRRAAVALGRKRAVFPDDMPTLSALPWEEREKILSSMGNDGRSRVATWGRSTHMICLLLILGMPSSLFIALCVSLGPLKTDDKGGLNEQGCYLRKCLGGTMGREPGKAGRAVRLLCKSDSNAEGGNLGRTFLDCHAVFCFQYLGFSSH